MWTKLTNWLTEKEKTPLDNHNESTRTWSSGYRKAFHETLNYLAGLRPGSSNPKDKRPLIAVILIIALCFSLFFVLHTRDSPTVSSSSVSSGNNVDIAVNVGDTLKDSQKININTSSVQALESLPGIGDVLASRIIDGRPYKDVYELDKVQGIGPATIDAIKDKVIAK